ncbi:hypothetical protein D3C80_1808830 [compost metagenome]
MQSGTATPAHSCSARGPLQRLCLSALLRLEDPLLPPVVPWMLHHSNSLQGLMQQARPLRLFPIYSKYRPPVCLAKLYMELYTIYRAAAIWTVLKKIPDTTLLTCCKLWLDEGEGHSKERKKRGPA